MRSWWDKTRWKLIAWMQGRYGQYGSDQLSDHLTRAGMILMILSIFRPLRMLYGIAFVLVFYSVFRLCSKNFRARQRELYHYERLMQKPRGYVKLWKLRIKERDTSRFYRCKCGAIIRVPKGRGKIEITCRKCGKRMIKRT
ncbi:MAG: hypothetical protein LUD07_03475 [Clostridiales bacterium]|nr:hypothetical protein [Clostridiales bacterium]